MPDSSRISLSDYMTRRLAAGQVVFTPKEALTDLKMSRRGFLKAAEREQSRHKLFNPRHGFYVVVPPQYLSWKAPPPAWYIDDLMRHEGHAYYVGLLKAAELHGATHQAVMEFQVVTDKRIPNIRAGRSIIAFFYRKNIARVAEAVTDHKTEHGTHENILARIDGSRFATMTPERSTASRRSSPTSARRSGPSP